ncbi:hypothetical protein H4582DRAFT_458339 [Lactarius indigo]|nr:hypothetical protein H4582DRAFT_458339 [Lactarius indigo]
MLPMHSPPPPLPIIRIGAPSRITGRCLVLYCDRLALNVLRLTSTSSSRRVLAHVLARKERDSKQMHQLLKLTFAKLDEESQRATDAERRAAECLVRARAAIDARAQADADAASARTELAMYKLQLDQAQREIFRAQEMLTGLEARRHDAEEDAARARSVARKLQEERAVEAAREEGKQQGWHEGLRRGMLLGRQEAEEELARSRRREEDMRSRSRPRRVDDPLFSRVALDHPPMASEESSPERVTPHPPPARTRNGRRTPDISPQTPAPPGPNRVPPFAHRGSHPELASSIRRRQHNEGTPQQRSRSRPRFEASTPPPAVPEPARSRPYTPHEDSTPSIIQPIPVPASASSSSHPLPVRASPSPSPSPSHVHHAPVQIPPDNWIPRAQDASGDGRLSIYLPPPHELIEPLHVPDGPYAIAATPEEGSPAVVPPPPPPDLSPSTHVYAPTPPPPDLGPSASQTPRRGRTRRPREREYNYGPPPPRPDLEQSTASNHVRDYASAPPPPPDIHPASAPRHIAKVASNHSRASTHLSEFDILAPVDQSRSIGPQPMEPEQVGEPDGELEYVDAPTEPIPRQPIAPNPPLQRRRATYDRRPSRGPPPPRQIILPAPLSQTQPVAGPPPPPLVQQPYVYTPQPQHSQQVPDSNDDMGFENDNENDEDAPLLAVPPSERNRPHRSRTQSSGVIGISVEPPSPGNSPPSSGNNTALQRRADLLSPEHAERPLPLAMPVQIPYIDIFSASRNKPQPQPPQQRSRRHAREEQERPLTPLPELELAGFVPPGMTVTNPESSPGASASDLHHSAAPSHSHHAYRHTRNGGGGGMRYEYEAAPVPDGMEYPASPLVGQPGARPGGGAPPRRRGTASTKTKEGGEGPLSPLAVASGLLGLKGRLGMPWRRNTAK